MTASQARSVPAIQAVTPLLRQLLGDQAVLTDDASRTFYANDIFWQPAVLPEAIVLPATAEQAAGAIHIATRMNRALCDRFVVTHHPDGWLKRLN